MKRSIDSPVPQELMDVFHRKITALGIDLNKYEIFPLRWTASEQQSSAANYLWGNCRRHFLQKNPKLRVRCSYYGTFIEKPLSDVSWYAAGLQIDSLDSGTFFIYEMEDSWVGGVGKLKFEFSFVVSDLADPDQAKLRSMIAAAIHKRIEEVRQDIDYAYEVLVGTAFAKVFAEKNEIARSIFNQKGNPDGTL